MAQEHDFASAESTAVTVGATTTEVLAAKSGRRYAQLTNDGAEEMYISFGVDAVMNKGIRLNRRGGSVTISGTKLYRNSINAICASGGQNMCILEA